MALAAVDPRIERSRCAVLEATVALLAESGYGAVTIEAVAARSGVAKSTIYRHWPGRVELIHDAFLELKPPVVVPSDGDVREQVIAVLENFQHEDGSVSVPEALQDFGAPAKLGAVRSTV